MKMDEAKLISKAMSILGRRTSAKKRRAARANAKRPRPRRYKPRLPK
jgi:hypothetical protein